jgi:hypothetical protein
MVMIPALFDSGFLLSYNDLLLTEKSLGLVEIRSTLKHGTLTFESDSTPPIPHNISFGSVIFKQLNYVELIVVVAYIGLSEKETINQTNTIMIYNTWIS